MNESDLMFGGEVAARRRGITDKKVSNTLLGGDDGAGVMDNFRPRGFPPF